MEHEELMNRDAELAGNASRFSKDGALIPRSIRLRKSTAVYQHMSDRGLSRRTVQGARWVMMLQQRWKPCSWGMDHKPRSRFSIVVFNPRAITCKVIIPTSRLPNSMSDMCPLFMSRLTAISVCVQPFFLLCARMRFPSCTKRA